MLSCDYLIQGAGAMGMAAADELLAGTDAELLIVDRHHRPGGHWNDAYPFVRLHQPSVTYGVNSRPLGRGNKDEVGLNRGLYELASGAEVLAYFDAVMREQFLPSGRVTYLPSHEVLEDGRVRCLLSGRVRTLQVRRKTLVASALNTQVPATRPPQYAVDAGVRCISPNALPLVANPPDGWVVVGGGKTAMDAVVWLLQQGVEPAAVRWIVPRDSWLIDRALVQPAPEFFIETFGSVVAQLQAVVDASSMADLYHRLEAAGQLLRLDPAVEPGKYYCATVSRAELAQLRRVTQVLRMGYVRRIAADRIELDGGSVPTTPGTVHVDCSATAIPLDTRIEPVFQGTRVVLQMVRACQPVFSAALIAKVEATWPGLDDEARKNELCTVVPMPGPGLKWLEMMAANMANQHRWTRDETLAKWLVASRLDRFAALSRSIGEHEADKRELLQRIRTLGGLARAKFPQLLAAG
jgi:NAD(P)-binding Rossmann-like domain